MARPEDEFEAHLRRLETLLCDLIELFRATGETFWHSWAERGRDRLQSYDDLAFDAILSGFGGMGSVNDLLLLRTNCHLVAEADEIAVNEQLRDLTGAVWEEATYLRHLLRAR